MYGLSDRDNGVRTRSFIAVQGHAGVCVVSLLCYPGRSVETLPYPDAFTLVIKGAAAPLTTI